MSKIFSKVVIMSGVMTSLIAPAVAGPESVVSAGSVEGPIEIAGPGPTPIPGIPYHEYFAYSAYAKRSYVPGYTPHTTSLFENPRTYPRALGALATPYHMYAGLDGWYFGSPRGYRTGTPKGSQAHAYFQGRLGVTSNLRGGYPQGMRVIEPAIVPVGSSMERGGIYIHGGGVTQVETTIEETIRQETLAKPAAPILLPPPVLEK